MTAQQMEKLIFNGKEVSVATEPLDPYLSNLKEKPKLFPPSSTCWRGYVGTWEIKNDKLYLIAFEGYTVNMVERRYWQVGMDFIFPNHKEVFAEWFTGELRIPQGDMLEYVHGGYESTFESDLLLVFKNGHLSGQRTVDNILEAAKKIINKDEKVLHTKEISHKNESFSQKILGLLKSKKYR